MSSWEDPLPPMPPDLPVGTVVAIGHPPNQRLAVRAPDWWRALVFGAPPVPADDWRVGWSVVGVPPSPAAAVTTPPIELDGVDGAGKHAQWAEECLAQLGHMAKHGGETHPHLPRGDAATLAAMAQTHALLAGVAEVRDLRVVLVQAVDDLREAVEAVELGVDATIGGGDGQD